MAAHYERQVQSKIKVMLSSLISVELCITNINRKDKQWRKSRLLSTSSPPTRWKKKPDLWTAKNWQLHHDNASAHSSYLIQTFLAKHGIPVVHQSPHSPDMTPCVFWLFPKLKKTSKGSRFESREEITHNATGEMNTIPKHSFQKCFRQWKDRRAKCVKMQGVYFEGD